MILAGRHGNVEVRDASLGALLEIAGVSSRSHPVALAPASEIAGLPAFQQGIRIASQAVAKLDMGVWRGEDGDRARVTGSWQARFFANPPNPLFTWMEVWEGLEGSLTARNNGFWLKTHDMLTGQIASVETVHPDAVQTRWNQQSRRPEYRVRTPDGPWSDWLTTSEVLHFRVGFPAPGALLAPSPLELHRRAWATMLSKGRAEARVWDEGGVKASAVIFPETVTPDQARVWHDVFEENGGRGDSPVKVFGGNPKVESIGLSFEDQQFVDSQQFSIQDVGRILGVPPSLLWSGVRYGDKPLTPEHEEDRWFRYGLGPRRTRIEQKILSDPDFFGVGARTYPWFYASRPRGDAQTESELLVREVQAGIRLVDEARAALGLPDLPNGQGKIPQITPVGGAPNATPPPAPAD